MADKSCDECRRSNRIVDISKTPYYSKPQQFGGNACMHLCNLCSVGGHFQEAVKFKTPTGKSAGDGHLSTTALQAVCNMKYLDTQKIKDSCIVLKH